MIKKSLMTQGLLGILYESPFPPLFFLAFFCLFILAQFVRLPTFFHLDTNLLLVSNICFLLLIGLRFVRYFSLRNREIRYGSGGRPASGTLLSGSSSDSVRQRFADAGYRFDDSYGEKHTLSYLGMTLLYGGLFLALAVGSFENLRQFSCVMFHNAGMSAALDDPQQYLKANLGPLASLKGMPRLQIKKMILPCPQWPKGAIEISLTDDKAKVLTEGTLENKGKPLTYNGMEYYFTRFLYDFILEIGTKNNYLEFSDTVKFEPMVTPINGYTHSVKFKGERLKWNALLDPQRMAIKLAGGKEKKLVEGEIVFRRDQVAYAGEYDVKIGGMAQWAEIHIMRPRHMYIVYLGGALALIGLLMRLLFHPQRVWLEGTPEGTRVWATGGETKKLVKG